MPDKLPQWGAVQPVREAWSCAFVPQSGRLHAAGMETGNRLAKSPHTLGAIHMIALLYVLVLFTMVQAFGIASAMAGTIDWVQAFMPAIFVGGIIGFCLVMHAIYAIGRLINR